MYLSWKRAHPEMFAWCQEHAIDLGSSDSVETHCLVLDRQSGEVWVAPKQLAAAIVRAQDLELAEP